MKLEKIIITMINGKEYTFTDGSQYALLKSINDDGTFKYKALNINGAKGFTDYVLYTDNISELQYIRTTEEG